MVPFSNLLVALGDVPDPRRAQGKRYPLQHLLVFTVLALLSGAQSCRGIITFLDQRVASVESRAGLKRSVTRRTRSLAGVFGRQGGFHWAKPVLGIQAAPDAGLEGGVRPVDDMRNVPVFDRVEVDIVNVRGEIPLVANGMLPKAPLPDTTLPVPFANIRTALPHGLGRGRRVS